MPRFFVRWDMEREKQRETGAMQTEEAEVAEMERMLAGMKASPAAELRLSHNWTAGQHCCRRNHLSDHGSQGSNKSSAAII